MEPINVALVQERLIYLYNTKYDRGSIRTILREIINSQSTSYEIIESKIPEEIEKDQYDNLYDLKYDAFRSFLFKVATFIDEENIQEIKNFLIEKNVLHAKELEKLPNNPFFTAKKPPNLTPTEMREMLEAFPVGEFCHSERNDVSLQLSELVCVRPKRSNQFKVRHIRAEYDQRTNEDESSFQIRLSQGRCDRIEKYSGILFVSGKNTYSLVERSNADLTLDMASVNIELETEVIKLSYIRGSNYRFFPLSSQSGENLKCIKALIIKANQFLFDNSFYNIHNISSSIDINIGFIMSIENDFLKAASEDDVPGLVKCLLSGVDANCRSEEDGKTAFHKVALNRSYVSLMLLRPEQDDISTVRENILSSFVPEFGSLEEVEHKWLEAISSINPLVLDKDGYLPSGNVPSIRPFDGSTDGQIGYDFAKRVMNIEARVADEAGVDYFDFALSGNDMPWPSLQT
ncbi:hypothetical protein [Roseibium sp.]|uniref:hypothetical protein n=1 Tax=Roseibium sp. TaxID=1936156 RepID=UPI003A9692EB